MDLDAAISLQKHTIDGLRAAIDAAMGKMGYGYGGPES